MLHLLPHTAFSLSRWDTFIAASPQRVVYAYSWYLEVVSPQWQALVLEEEGIWKAVMPLPIQPKWGLNVVKQPFYCQFLEIFTAPSVEPTSVQNAFLETISTHFRYVSSYSGRFLGEQFPPQFEHQHYYTHLFPLDAPYPTLRQRYSPDRRMNLRRALNIGWELQKSQDLMPLITLFRAHHADHIPGGVAETAYELLQNITAALQNHQAARLVYALKDGNIETGALFAIHDQRIIYLFNAASPIGRKGNARTLLIDDLIQTYANSGYIFDFESPEKASIASFYASFGAKAERYSVLHYNNLPFPLKQLQAYRRKKSQR